MRKLSLLILLLVLPSVLSVVAYFLLKPKPVPTDRHAIGQVTTLAGTGEPALVDGTPQQASFSDPFGIAVDSQSSVYITDGGESNRIRRIKEGKVETIAGSVEGFADGKALSAQFNSPSGLCIGRRGLLIIADTGNNRIRMIDTQGDVTTMAGTGEAGYKDGPAAEAQFDGPIGVAVDEDGVVYVADTYNDCIRKIKDGEVSTIAGNGQPGYSDGQASESLFDTPCGIAVDKDGNLFVADTGNRAVRKITAKGDVTTSGGGMPDQGDVVYGGEVHYDRPVGITLTADGFLFVADEGGFISKISPEGDSFYYAGWRSGFADDLGWDARFNAPSGIAVDKQGKVYISDRQNYLIRLITPTHRSADDKRYVRDSYLPGVLDKPIQIQPPSSENKLLSAPTIPKIELSKMTSNNSFPWPLAPQDSWHEVTGVVGEARGAPGGVALHHLHSGLDLRGNMGDPVLSSFSEKVSSPMPNWDYNGSSEGIQVGLISYIHIRVGRDIKDQILQPEKFKARFDQSAKLIGVRVRRGTRFKVGDTVGTLNRLYHVHMNIGPWNAQVNPIFVLSHAFKDTIAPTIEPDGIEIVDTSGKRFTEKRDGRLVVSGDVDVVVTAFDRSDGNNASRKLGLYKLGYQLLKEDNSPVTGFEHPIINIDFGRMPAGDESVFVAYADGSGVSAYGTPTKFKYIATNLVRDGIAIDGFLRTKMIEPGNYILKILAEDFAGNRASGAGAEIRITIPSV